ELSGVPGVTIIAEQDAWEAAQATSAVTELLAKKPDVVWAANEGGTVGAVVAVRNAGAAGKVTVFGTDLSAQLLGFLEAQDGILQAVTAQAPVEMGSKAIEAAGSPGLGPCRPSFGHASGEALRARRQRGPRGRARRSRDRRTVSAPALEVRGLGHRYGESRGPGDLTLAVAPGPG